MTSIEFAIKEASKQVGLPVELVDKVYKAYWKAIRDYIQSLDVKDISESEFSSLRTSFNIPSLGKLYTNFSRVQGVKSRFEYLQKIKNNDFNKEIKADV